MMEAFSPALWYELPTRGWVAVIQAAVDYDPTPLVRQPITLSGTTYVVQQLVVPAVDNPTPGTFAVLVGDPVGT